jgi:hypothetical protein
MRLTQIALVLLASLIASPVLAQRSTSPLPRWGVVAGFGVGRGSAEVQCGGCSSGGQGGPSMHARIGGALREDLLLVAELDAFSGSKYVNFNTTSSSLVALDVVAQLYPLASHGYFVTAGVGAGRVESSGSPVYVDYRSPIGPAYKVGTGYDINVTRAFAITPFVSYLYVAGGIPEGGTEKISGSVILIGVDVNLITRQLLGP